MNEIVQTILDQLGGRKMLVMTGAKVETFTENSVRLKLPIGKLTKFEVVYECGSDTYTVNCIKGRGMSCRLAKDPIHDVFADDLIPLFEQETGLYAHM